MNDSDLNDLFAAPQVFDDAEIFETRTRRKLATRLWLRQWLVVLAGFVGGVYALFQFIHVPDSPTSTPLKQAQVDTDQSLQAGVKLVDGVGHQLSGLTTTGVHALDLMQTPVFFWVAFALCLSFLGLYYAYSREETL